MLWLALVLFISLAIALLRGGRLTNLGDIHLRMWWLLPLALALQVGARFLPEGSANEGTTLVLLSYVPLLVLVVLNRDRTGMWMAGAGVLMNFTVIIANHGMPVLSEAAYVASGFTSTVIDFGEGFKHVPLDETSHLVFLADVIPLRLANIGQVLSLGDVFLALGLGRFLDHELRKPIRWFKRGARAQAGSASEL
jgi:hypothetical protein